MKQNRVNNVHLNADRPKKCVIRVCKMNQNKSNRIKYISRRLPDYKSGNYNLLKVIAQKLMRIL